MECLYNLDPFFVVPVYRQVECAVEEGHAGSIHLDASVYSSNKHIRRQEPNRPRRQRIHRTRECAVAEKQQTAHKPFNVQSCGIVPCRIHKNPEPRRCAHKKRLPPPVVVFRAELDVCRNDDRLGDGDGEQSSDDAQEAKDVVVG